MATHIEIKETVGRGAEEVYAYSFPSMIVGDRWPIKIGKAKRDSIRRITEQQASMIERPTVWIIFKTDNCAHLEKVIHLALASHKLPTFGREWFSTNPEEIKEAIVSRLNPSNTIGDMIRLARHERGLSQTELADKAGIRQATVSAVESDKNVRLSTVMDLASAMGKRFLLVDAAQ